MSYLASSSPVGVFLLPSGVHLYKLFAYAVAYHHVTSTTSTPTPSYIYLLAPSSLPIYTHFLRIVFTSISITDSILLSICRHIMSVKHSKLESPWKAVQNFKLGSIGMLPKLGSAVPSYTMARTSRYTVYKGRTF